MRVKPRKTEPGDHLGTKHLDPTVQMVMVESFMVAPTGWRRERLYRAHSVKSAVTARSPWTIWALGASIPENPPLSGPAPPVGW